MLHSATRQACAVYLKNTVFKSYSVDASRRPDQAVVHDSDRQALKSAILPLLSSSPSRSITLQLSAALKIVVARDYPEQWPGLLDEVKRMLGSNEIREVASGCVASLEVIRAFRYVILSSKAVRMLKGFVDSARMTKSFPLLSPPYSLLWPPLLRKWLAGPLPRPHQKYPLCCTISSRRTKRAP